MITKAASGVTARRAHNMTSAGSRWGGLGTRVLSASVLGCIAIILVFLGNHVFLAAIVVFAVLMAYEWNMLSAGDSQRLFMGGHIGIAGCAIILVGAGHLEFALGVCLGGALVLSALAVYLKRPVSWPVLGVFYIVIPCASVVILRGSDAVGMMMVYWSFAVVWATDIGAYVFGKTLGGPRLAPKTSPNKTWSGLIGGTLCGTATGAAVALVTGLASVETLAALSFGLTFAAHGGDFVESALKRRFGAKDSSSLIPGHGGVLDRVDGLIFVWPAMVGAQFLHGQGILPWVAR